MSSRKAQEPITILGVKFSSKDIFKSHLEMMVGEVKKGLVRRLRAALPQGPLNDAARALVFGRAQGNAWVTLTARLETGKGPTSQGARQIQIALNDLARAVLGVRKDKKVTIQRLLTRTGFPTVNELVVEQSAMAAWKAQHHVSSPLLPLMRSQDGRTRAGTSSLHQPTSMRSTAANNMAAAWGASAELREAATQGRARAAAKKLAKKWRHAALPG